jgi:hypothetical protein
MWTLPGKSRTELGDVAAQQSANFVDEMILGSIAASQLSYSLAGAEGYFDPQTPRDLAMDPFEKKRLLPIEVMIALAINVVVAILGYYAIMMWGLVRG